MSENVGNRVPLGHISAAYGMKGWVRIFSCTDPIEQILEYSPWILGGPSPGKNGSGFREIKVEKGRKHGRGIVALLTGMDNRDQAEALIGTEILVEREQFPELEKGEYYWHELQGLEVVNTSGEVFGKVDHLIGTGANDVLVVEPMADSLDDRTRLIPFVEDKVVREVDLGSLKIVVDWQAVY